MDGRGEPGDLHLALVDRKCPLGVEDQVMFVPSGHDAAQLRTSPRVLPARCASRHHFDLDLERVGPALEVVEDILIRVDPGGGQHVVDEAPADAQRSVSAAVLVQGEERPGVGFQSAAQLRHPARAEIAEES